MKIVWWDSDLQPEYRGLGDEYVRATKEFFADRLCSICFFGSVVRGETTPESDIDVLVIAEKLPKEYELRVRETSPIHEKLRHSEVYRKLRSIGRSTFVSDLFFTPDEAKTHPPILLDMTEDASVAYDRGRFLKSILDQMRGRLKELGARKVKARKAYHWILKPDAKPNEVIKI